MSTSTSRLKLFGMDSIWFSATASVRPADLQALHSAAQQHGIALQEGLRADAQGLIVCGDADKDVHALLRDARGEGRLLVLHLGASRLPHAACWALLAAGAADVLSWPAQREALVMAAERLARWREVDAVLASPLVRDNLVGSSPAWQRVLRDTVELACFSDANVLVIGESGTGKELVARLIHTLDRRAHKAQLVVLDCATLAPELAGSEFFGHERGAFTGATAPRDGAFALAHGGTLFLDEIGELPPNLQPQLLRVIQERCVKRLGSGSWQKSEFRLVCATHRDLDAEVACGAFRADLYYRVSGCRVRLPALSQRRDDIVPLARRFLGETCQGGTAPELEPAVVEYLKERPFPGNVRELRQLIVRIASRHVGRGPITVGDIPEEDRPAAPRRDRESDRCREPLDDMVRGALQRGLGLKEISGLATEAAIRMAVDDEGGNLQRAAHRLRVTDRALQLRRAQRASTAQ